MLRIKVPNKECLSDCVYFVSVFENDSRNLKMLQLSAMFQEFYILSKVSIVRTIFKVYIGISKI